GPVSLAEIREWMVAHGLETLYNQSIAGTDMPPVADRLADLGFSRHETPTDLTYLGIRAEQSRIIDLDPERPAAQPGFQKGDQIVGYFPSRPDQPRVSPDILTPYTYGLTTIEPGVSGTFVEVKRGEKELKLPVHPRVIGGGLVPSYVANEGRLRSFFK